MSLTASVPYNSRRQKEQKESSQSAVKTGEVHLKNRGSLFGW